jgi:hypothetical protein
MVPRRLFATVAFQQQPGKTSARWNSNVVTLQTRCATERQPYRFERCKYFPRDGWTALRGLDSQLQYARKPARCQRITVLNDDE